MVFIELMDESGSLITTINPDIFFPIFIIVISICVFLGLIYLIIELINLMNEQKRYYRSLNKKLKGGRR